MDKEVGELITKGERIAQIDDLTQYKVQASIDEYYINRIFLGQKGRFKVNNNIYILTVKNIYPEVNNGTFDVDLIFESDVPENIRRGQTLSIRLELSAEKQALLLSKGSFFQSTGGQWVYVIRPDGSIAYKKEVTLGKQNPHFLEVTSGLQAGEVVIVSSYDSFGDKDELILK